jgi:hypothetical protein
VKGMGTFAIRCQNFLTGFNSSCTRADFYFFKILTLVKDLILCSAFVDGIDGLMSCSRALFDVTGRWDQYLVGVGNLSFQVSNDLGWDSAKGLSEISIVNSVISAQLEVCDLIINNKEMSTLFAMELFLHRD